jgi:hypothetical protein
LPRQSNGTYVAPSNTAAVSGQTISSTAYNSLTSDLGTEITNSLDREGRSAMQANLPMGSYLINNLGTPVASTDAATKGYIDTATSNMGYLNIPESGGAANTTNYTAVLTDQGKMIVMNGTSLTATIPANASVAYQVGTVLTFININSSALSIAITSDTLTLVNSTTTGTRTLNQNGIATAVKVASTSWIISGAGVS